MTYYGTAEIAEACGVTQQAVSNWLARDQMPRPTARLRMGPIWSLESPDFAEWLTAKGRSVIASPQTPSSLSSSPRPRNTSPPLRVSGERRDSRMGDLATSATEVRAALERQGLLDKDRIPARPGLYAIHGRPPTWVELGLGEPPDDRPLYIGKAEDNLVSRILDTHLRDGRTGWSTLRRSLAALLHDTHLLRGIPRNPANPGRFSNFGLSEAHDSDLTSWMYGHLQLAVWVKPIGNASLEQIETELLHELQPPLNTRGVLTPWTSQVKAARKVMAEEAKAWAAEQSRA